MRFPSLLTEAKLIRRYKRFLADVEMPSGEIVAVHCANPGAMTGLAAPGSRIYLSRSPNLTRKLQWSWELVEVDGTLVGINTAHPNNLAAEALAAGAIPELAAYQRTLREVRYGKNSRVDFVLSGSGRPDAYVEIKSVTLVRQPGLAEFPDSVTRRGARHLDELAGMVAAGHRAVTLFLIQRGDAERLAIARDIDPGYAAAFDRAKAAGVEMLAYRCRVEVEGISVSERLTIDE